ncbi:hypothetical protein [Arenimonas fontis]|uniref:Uncharacterized protein n=1 Tax=Arenimonas fontis TaxID=2608255 RepID=A0A5B2ZA10_9GAMM|nr:hypothetical protein [Arenimonas fontis]KAA2284765.1 hypothetical protein F0415_08700 [Arenimonas fontis]
MNAIVHSAPCGSGVRGSLRPDRQQGCHRRRLRRSSVVRPVIPAARAVTTQRGGLHDQQERQQVRQEEHWQGLHCRRAGRDEGARPRAQGRGQARLDEGAMWPTSFGLVALGKAEQERIRALLRKALG